VLPFGLLTLLIIHFSTWAELMVNDLKFKDRSWQRFETLATACENWKLAERIGSVAFTGRTTGDEGKYGPKEYQLQALDYV